VSAHYYQSLLTRANTQRYRSNSRLG